MLVCKAESYSGRLRGGTNMHLPLEKCLVTLTWTTAFRPKTFLLVTTRTTPIYARSYNFLKSQHSTQQCSIKEMNSEEKKNVQRQMVTKQLPVYITEIFRTKGIASSSAIHYSSEHFFFFHRKKKDVGSFVVSGHFLRSLKYSMTFLGWTIWGQR